MKLYCVVIYVTSSYIWQTQQQCRWRLRGIIYSVECKFFVDVCLCYHNSNNYARIKNDGIRPLRTYASQLDYYTLVVWNWMAVI